MIDLQIFQNIQNIGFGVVPQVISPQKILALTSELEAAIEVDNQFLNQFSSDHPRQKDRSMVHNCMTRGPHLASILDLEIMHAYLSEFLSSTCIMYAYQSSSMPPRKSNYSNRIHVDCPRFIPNYTTNMGVIIALTDFTEANGATLFYPKSHLNEKAPSEEEFQNRALQATCKAGDMIVFNARCWHAGGVNNTDQPRHSLTINVCRSYMRQRFDYPRLLESHHPEVLNWVGPKGRQFLGYNVRVPTSLEEFYLPEDQRLYKANQG